MSIMKSDENYRDRQADCIPERCRATSRQTDVLGGQTGWPRQRSALERMHDELSGWRGVREPKGPADGVTLECRVDWHLLYASSGCTWIFISQVWKTVSLKVAGGWGPEAHM